MTHIHSWNSRNAASPGSNNTSSLPCNLRKVIITIVDETIFNEIVAINTNAIMSDVFIFSDVIRSFKNRMEYIAFVKYNNKTPNKEVDCVYIAKPDIMNIVNVAI